jgi:hypothetical protein
MSHTRDEAILAETIAGVEQIHGDDLDRIHMERATAGLFFTGAKLSTGAAGACASPASRARAAGDIT